MMRRHSGSGAGGPKRLGVIDDEIQELISTQVTLAVREAIPKLFEYVKTTLIEMFDERLCRFHRCCRTSEI